jgi:peptidoglycan/xylan/chitin deacetylase (PgdA/CDA1 family)
MQFDDGWSSWRTQVAPLLARYGGRATGFVNNQHMRSGRITADDLRALQNDFGWEIGSHAYHHLNAVRFVQQRGLEAWKAEELVAALGELRGAG